MYLAIQSARFAERLRVTIDVDEELGGALVPGLILQPIVENAIKHGIAQREAGGAIAIRAVHGDGRLTATICNDGPPLRPDWESVGAAIGLTNVRDRLRGLYGDAAAFEIANAGSTGVRVTISVPLRGA
jgi:LytS/YehU family sensor histidine kinase